ncbi:PREDICTED: uncharacterized protein LOC109238964 [Nicotiana attenuata]|uniref:uncharacterized protein LOC109238964 n=1 Tax=Nicotiana attenuata TaxID=49451 RepID=UPI0009049354|nr:PREDICTED: uncharacterized protein LOC109238964 [Nicotiana attenuata]
MVKDQSLVCKLNKSLYSLKQASRQWYEKLTEALCSKGFNHNMNDYSLFYKQQGDSVVYGAVYADDVLVTSTNQEEIGYLKAFLLDKFKINDLGNLHYFLGLEVLYKHDSVIMSQRKFVLDLLKEYNCLEYSVLSSPFDPNEKLKAKEGKPLEDPTSYRELIGKLNILTNTRLDIAFGVQHLSQFMQDLREPHLKATYHLLRYLKGDPTLGVFMSNIADWSVRAFCDFDWASYPDSRRSVSGYKSKKQETISLSSAEATYMSLRKVIGELVWLSRLLTELRVPSIHPIVVFCDSLSALNIAKNPVFHERTKHIEVDCHFVRKQLQEGLISLHHITTDQQLTYILTKSLTGIKHSSILGKLTVFSTPPTRGGVLKYII